MADRWRAIEFRHLTALRAVASERSFNGAASRLGYTQSAISQQLAALERIVGKRLVERPGGRSPVTLTEAGSLLLSHADAIAARVSTAEAELLSLREGGQGTLKIGSDQAVGTRLMPELLRGFSALSPGADLQLFEASSDGELLRALEFGEADLAFVNLPLARGPFEAVELIRAAYVFVVQARSPLAHSKTAPTLTELAAMPLLCLKTARHVERFLPLSVVDGPNVVFRSEHNDTLQAMAAAGLGLALMPRLAVDESDDEICVIEPTPPLPPCVIALAWHKERIQRPLATAFVEFARSLYCERDRHSGSGSALGTAAENR